MKNVFSFVLGIILLTGCNRNQATNTDAPEVSSNIIKLSPTQYKAIKITTSVIETRPIGTTLQANGILDVPPQNLITIAAPMGGFVKSTKLLQGMKVKKGEVVVTLENQDYIQLQQEYLDNKSKLEYLEAEYNRQAELAKENINAQKALQQAKSQHQSTRAAVKALEAKLAMININASALTEENMNSTVQLHAPITGYVTVVNVNIGQFVNATNEMFKIVNIEHIHAELQVYEKDINRITVGQKVVFQLAHEKETRSAAVYLIGKEISPERTVRIHCHLDKEDEHLLPGMYITATIETATHQAEVVPSTSVVNFEGKEYVFAATGNPEEFELISATTGLTDAGYSEITLPTGFNKQRQIVVTGAFELLGIIKNTEEEGE